MLIKILLSSSTGSTGDAALSSFQEVVDILDQSLQRRDGDSSMASSIRSTSSILRT